MESLKDNQLNEVLEKHPKILYKGKDIKTRTPFHWVARKFYKTIRAIYVSILFYFIPYGVFFVLFVWSLTDGAGEGDGE